FAAFAFSKPPSMKSRLETQACPRPSLLSMRSASERVSSPQPVKIASKLNTPARDKPFAMPICAPGTIFPRYIRARQFARLHGRYAYDCFGTFPACLDDRSQLLRTTTARFRPRIVYATASRREDRL